MDMATSVVFVLLPVIVAVALILGSRAIKKRRDIESEGSFGVASPFTPESSQPPSSSGGPYLITALIIAIGVFLSLLSTYGKATNSQDDIDRLKSEVEWLAERVDSLEQQLAQSVNRIEDSSWEITDPDYANKTAQIRFWVSLKQFSDDTTVVMNLNGTDIPLTQQGSPRYEAQFAVNLFEKYEYEPMVRIIEGAESTVERVDFPEYVFWDVLPMPSLSCRLSSQSFFGKLSYEGDYNISFNHIEDVEAVFVTYLSGGKELTEAVEVTEEALTQKRIELEKGMKLEHDLTVQIDIVTKSGFRIIERNVLIHEAVPEFSDSDSTRIMDRDGNLLWEESAA